MISERTKYVARRIPLAYPVFLHGRRNWRNFYRWLIQVSVPHLPIKRIGGAGHAMPGELVVSLTSYPPRFHTLHLTLVSLLRQAVCPDRIILWIAKSDIHRLPPKVRKLKKYGLEIKLCDDIGSYKKIVPTLKICPNAFIATADDDIYYRSSWLSTLTSSYRSRPSGVVCHRAHRIRLNADGEPKNYNAWQWDIREECESELLVPTTGAGVLYSPGAFDERVLDEESFLTLCPTTDDIWLYWMARLNQTSVRVLRGRKHLISWAGSQASSLSNENLGEKSLNDLAVRNLSDKYGFPGT